MKKLPKKLILRDRKLLRENAQGQAIHPDLLEVDPRLTSRDRLNTVLHEAIHLCFPNLSERDVRAVTVRLFLVLWEDRWRRLEP